MGGRQRSTAHFSHEWHGFRQAVIVRADPKSGEVETVVEYTSPPHASPEDRPSILFKAGSIVDGVLYVCTQTEVLGYSLPDFLQVAYLSLPFFQDLHHVTLNADGNYLIAVTGLDMVAEVTAEGEVLRQWNVLGEDPWHRFSPDMDYRRVLTTKPHASHPNYVFLEDGEVWATRFEQRDAVCLTAPGRRIEVGIERVHDGVVAGDRILFTTVNGWLVVIDRETHEARVKVDLNEIYATDRALGWCRGLAVLADGVVVVGFSRLRPSPIRQNLRWMQHRFGKRATKGNLPSRIAAFDLQQRRLLWELDLERAGLNALFSIHPAGEVGDGALT